MKFRLLATILAMLASTSGSRAQAKYPPETRNAALRYWAAFVEMKDPLGDMETRKFIEKTLAGEMAWSETTLGSTLDANAEAIRTMQRGTKLPECDWGLEYSRGPKVPAPFFLRARALAGFNTLDGMRRMAKGDSQGAVNAWLAGIHFSQDLTRGEPLVFTLVATRVLLPELRVLAEDTGKGLLSAAQKKEVYAAVRALPEDGFDWREAWGLELAAGEQFLQELRTAANPGAAYEEMGMPLPKQGIPPTVQEIQGYREYMLAIQAALGEPPEKAKIDVDGLEAKRHTFGEVEQNLIPGPQGLNTVRAELVTARAELMQALISK